jgi:uncharacterized membrane protein
MDESIVGTGRLEAFSDGVFAIAVTLLVLNIKVPLLSETANGANLLSALRGQWPTYLAYVTSFLTILIMWVNHHTIFRLVRRSDNTLFLLNGLLLLCITFVPFPTSLLAEYIGHQGEHIAAAVYTGTLTVLAIVFNLLWHYAVSQRQLLRPDINLALMKRFTQVYALGPALYLLAFVLAFVHVGASVAVCVALGVTFALPITPGSILQRGARD